MLEFSRFWLQWWKFSENLTITRPSKTLTTLFAIAGRSSKMSYHARAASIDI